MTAAAIRVQDPRWSTAHWKEIPVAKCEPPAYTHLAEAFETVARRDLKTLQFANSDETRIHIDEAVASAPTIANTRAGEADSRA